jgi:hypothetical protein
VIPQHEDRKTRDQRISVAGSGHGKADALW